jgi:hypothetical protein
MTTPTKAQALEALRSVTFNTVLGRTPPIIVTIRDFIESVPDAIDPIGYTGSGSIEALKRGAEGHIWSDPAPAHPIALYRFAWPDTPPVNQTVTHETGNPDAPLYHFASYPPHDEPVAVEDLREGDRVRVTFEGVMVSEIGFRTESGYHFARDGSLIFAATIHRLPPKARPLEVGEVVFWKDDGPYEVFSHHGNLVWLKHHSNDGPNSLLHNVSDLRRPDGAPIEVAL